MRRIQIMKYIQFLISAFFSISVFFACDTNTKESTIMSDSKVLQGDAIKTCIDSIVIIYPPPYEESLDVLELLITSSDTSLSNILNSKQIEEIVFQKGDSSGGEEYRSGTSIQVKQISDNYYKLSYITSYFRDYPIDTVIEEGADFMETAQLKITDKRGVKWVIKTCSQEH